MSPYQTNQESFNFQKVPHVSPNLVLTPTLGGSLILIMTAFFSTSFGIFLFMAAIFMIINDNRNLQQVQSVILDKSENYSCSASTSGLSSKSSGTVETTCSNSYFVKYRYTFTDKNYEKNTTIDQSTWVFLKAGDSFLVYVDTKQPDYNTLTKESPFKNIALFSSLILLSLSVGSIFGLYLIGKTKNPEPSKLGKKIVNML